MNENTNPLPEQPNEILINSESVSTIGMYLKENELYDIFLRLKEHVETIFEVENTPPQ